MPTYSVKCPNCGSRSSFFSKIENRNLTPVCPMCGTTTERMLDTPMVQAQTISGIIRCSDGTIHEGHTSFERHMAKNGLIPGSDVESEANYRKVLVDKDIDTQRRQEIEKIATELGD